MSRETGPLVDMTTPAGRKGLSKRLVGRGPRERKIAVEFPLTEAQGMLLALGKDGEHSMSAAECDAAQDGAERLSRAVKIETQAGGDHHRSAAA